MEPRRFGRTGHSSTVAILGGAALGKFDAAADDADLRLRLPLQGRVGHRGIGGADVVIVVVLSAHDSLFFFVKKNQKTFVHLGPGG